MYKRQGKDGKITVSDLRSGYYREISAPQGYELDSTCLLYTSQEIAFVMSVR